MSEKIRCFISYAHEDADFAAIEHMKSKLNEYADGLINFMLDIDLDYGSNFKNYMEEIDNAHGIIVLFTPAYKQRVLGRKGGVDFEYNRIKQRYNNLIDAKRSGSDINKLSFVFIPVLFSGDHNSSIIDEFAGLKYVDLRKYRVHQNDKGEYYLNHVDKQHFYPIFRKFVDQLFAAQVTATDDFATKQHRLHESLFQNLKAEWILLKAEDRQLQNHLFVKTHSFNRVSSQSACLLIGRKGSGKSTSTIALSYLYRHKYKEYDPIVVDKFELEYIFSIFFKSNLASDVQNIFTTNKAFSFAWELFIYLYCMNIVVREYEKGSIVGERQKYVASIQKHLYDVMQDEDYRNFMCNSSSFVYCLTMLKHFTNLCISNARNHDNFFYSDIIREFTFDNFLLFTIGEKTLSDFESVIIDCKKKFLVTLDGFDQAFDEYRKTTIASYTGDHQRISERTLNEINWLTAFLNTVLRMKSNHEKKHFYSLIDFCVTIPKDRFLEIRKKERDTYIYSGRYSVIKWSGVELTILLRKRLEILGSVLSDKRLGFKERLDQVFEKGFKGLPTQTTTIIGENTYTHHIFLDVLRHTFWRPRDILWYFRNILSMYFVLNKKKRTLTNDLIRNIVSDTTFRVIDAEFIAEFRKSLLNIEEVLNVFKRSDNVLSFNNLHDKLSKVDFIFTYQNQPNNNFLDKIAFLYDIGFIGINADDRFLKRFGLKHKHVFSFNGGDHIIKTFSIEDFTELNYIIHPIFCEFLNLNIFQNILTLDFSWEYLIDNESFLFATT